MFRQSRKGRIGARPEAGGRAEPIREEGRDTMSMIDLYACAAMLDDRHALVCSPAGAARVDELVAATRRTIVSNGETEI